MSRETICWSRASKPSKNIGAPPFAGNSIPGFLRNVKRRLTLEIPFVIILSKRKKKLSKGRCTHEPGFDPRPCHQKHAAVCPAHDFGQPAPAVLQRGRHADCGPVSGVHGLGGGGLLLHADDLPHLHSAGDVHGQRSGVLHPLWGGRPAPAEKQPVPVLFADWRLYRGPECGGVFAHRPHDGAASGAGGRHPPDALLPVGDFLGHWGHLPVQLLCQPAAGRGELRHALGVLGRQRGAEHRAGLGVCGGGALGRGRGGLCHQLFPVGVWGGAAGVHLEAHGPPAPQPPGRLLEKGQGGGDCPVLPAHLRAAVGDELRHFDGAGAGELLWHRGDGRLRRRREDRFLRLHARAGLWQRLLHLYRPELRRPGYGPHPQGHTKRGACRSGVLRGCLRAGVRLRRALAAAFRQAGGEGNPGGGGAVPAR